MIFMRSFAMSNGALAQRGARKRSGFVSSNGCANSFYAPAAASWLLQGVSC
jgi:hypothetical protein